MDAARIIRELGRERDRLDKVIGILDSGDSAVVAGTAEVKPRRAKRRRHLTAAGRAKLSKLMRDRWKVAKKKGGSRLK